MSRAVKIEILPGVIAEEVLLGETLLMNVQTLAYFGLDPLGTRFWQAMQELSDPHDIVRRVAADTGRPESELKPRLESILSVMQRSGLIDVKPAPESK